MYYEKYLSILHKTSGWASGSDLAASPGCQQGLWRGEHAEAGVIISNHGGKVFLDGGDECRHVLVIGATGTGKSRLIIMPSLIYSLTARNRRSFVVFDVKGELEAATGDIAVRNGYEVIKIDFRHPEQSRPWNPFSKINRLWKCGGSGRKQALKLLEDLIAGVFQDGGSTRTDPFWKTSSAALFRGICGTLLESGRELTLAGIRRLSGSIPGDKDEDCDCLLFKMADRLAEGSMARRNLSSFMTGSNITRGNILTCYNTYISHMIARDDIVEMMSKPNTVDFQRVGTVPTVLYISLPDDTVALGALQGMLLTQLMQDMNECALTHGGRLPVRTEIYLDEICNIHPAIPGLETALTIARSRGIRYILAIQSYAQLSGVYGLAADTIAANCSTWIALNIAKDEVFRSKLSQLCGCNPLGEPLITPSQLALLRYEEGIVIRERVAPYFARFTDVGKLTA